MRRIAFFFLSLFLAGCGGSDFVDGPVGSQGDFGPGGPPAQDLPFLARSDAGQISRAANLVEIVLTGLDPMVTVGDNGEGGAITLQEFLSRAAISDTNPRQASLTYQQDDGPKQIVFSIVDARLQDDGTLAVTGIDFVQVTAQQDAVIEEFRNGVLRVAEVAEQSTPVGDIQGRVTGQNGSPLPGVTLALRDGPSPLLTVSDAQGRYRFLRVDPGTYSLEAALGGFESQTKQPLVVKVGETLNVNFVLQRATIEQTAR